MKVRMLTNSAGPKGVRHAGRVYDIDLKEAKALIEAKYAEDPKKVGAENKEGKSEE